MNDHTPTIRDAIRALREAGPHARLELIDVALAYKKWFYRDESRIPWPVPSPEEFGLLKDCLVAGADRLAPGSINVGGRVKEHYQMIVQRYWADQDSTETWKPTDGELKAAALQAIGEVDRLIDWLQEGAAGRPAAEGRKEYSIRRIARIWQLRYEGEVGHYPVKSHKAMGWLAQLLSAPNRTLTVAELLGDPGAKLAADALLGGERVTDRAGLGVLRKRLEEIEALREAMGGSESLDEERAELLQQLQPGAKQEWINSGVRRAYNNITTQLRALRRLLGKDMPRLAAHLKASLKPAMPNLGYYPPVGMPGWLVENPGT